MMIKNIWIQAVKAAWNSYVKKLNKNMKPETMDRYFNQKIDMGITLEEFAEMIFIEGFVAGELYNRTMMLEPLNPEPRHN